MIVLTTGSAGLRRLMASEAPRPTAPAPITKQPPAIPVEAWPKLRSD